MPLNHNLLVIRSNIEHLMHQEESQDALCEALLAYVDKTIVEYNQAKTSD